MSVSVHPPKNFPPSRIPVPLGRTVSLGHLASATNGCDVSARCAWVRFAKFREGGAGGVLARVSTCTIDLTMSPTTTITRDSNRALIMGVGIAGPALGIALRRAGLNAAVYEASAAPRDRGGAFLN